METPRKHQTLTNLVSQDWIFIGNRLFQKPVYYVRNGNEWIRTGFGYEVPKDWFYGLVRDTKSMKDWISNLRSHDVYYIFAGKGTLSDDIDFMNITIHDVIYRRSTNKTIIKLEHDLSETTTYLSIKNLNI
jgi:hypothetical protein